MDKLQQWLLRIQQPPRREVANLDYWFLLSETRIAQVIKSNTVVTDFKRINWRKLTNLFQRNLIASDNSNNNLALKGAVHSPAFLYGVY